MSSRVANRIHVSEETAKSHVSNILSKLGARDRIQAVVIAARRGIIDILNGSLDGVSWRSGASSEYQAIHGVLGLAMPLAGRCVVKNAVVR